MSDNTEYYLEAIRQAGEALAVNAVIDPRSWAALDARKEWLEGRLDDISLAVAAAHAWAAVDNAQPALSWNGAPPTLDAKARAAAQAAAYVASLGDASAIALKVAMYAEAALE